MLITKAKSLILKIIKIRVPKRKSFGLTSSNTFLFGSARWKKEEFLKKLDKQIIDSQGKIIYQNPDNQAYFRQEGWKISYLEQKTMFKFEKQKGNHEIKVFTHVEDEPPNLPDDPDDNVIEKNKNRSKFKPKNQQLNFSPVTIYIRKKGTARWLTAEMTVLEGSVELTGIFFSNLEPNLTWEKATYPGPEPQTLPEPLLYQLNIFFAELGLSGQMLINMVIHSCTKVDQLDLEWLKSLRQIWTT